MYGRYTHFMFAIVMRIKVDDYIIIYNLSYIYIYIHFKISII